MHYNEFLMRIHRLGFSPSTFAQKIGYSSSSVSHWKVHGIPEWVRTILDDKETIEFYQAAFREFNVRLSELEVHSGQLLQATNGFIAMGSTR